MSEPMQKSAEKPLEGFRNIFDRYYQPLCHLGKYYLQDEDEAKGVVQDAFVRFWEMSDVWDSDAEIRNLLFTIVKNRCLNVLKRRQRLAVHHDRIRQQELRWQQESLSRVGADYLELDELKEKIETSVKNLPEHCRRIFEMSRYEDLKNKEIAEKLGISQKTVESHMTNALRILRKDLKDYLPWVFALITIHSHSGKF